ncbi:5'/3'-nucleotidase SurE [Pelotomaculum propionicicum]|uniref:5'-nucleotidase SurE n=1 Tax=Pelotomaculum propionicicum TaxID=258475 RepID=A0A4Y7RMM1_9FIRM|nr:5'/3'-nucleotidase SurE [Pelotomaculum propionicicum]NLI13677.1 5'/3'-nucleotidase SurE [Peptococcaceae bacterium]TEB09989.1 5'-nucleotidase SurE [Pelotomaculum propionicicum]
MRILLSNDDGIEADGLNELRAALQEKHEIYVVAPDRERSATGHKITVHRPLRVKEWTYPGSAATGWAVDGTPADCVKLGLEALLPEPPDLVISGINFGPNLGTDVLYSGTVSAAVEGTINGIPSLAVSLASYEFRDFSYAGDFIKQIIAAMGKELPARTLLNINAPPGMPRGTKVTRLGNRRYVNIFDKRTDPRGRVYFWMAGEPFDLDIDDPETDVWAVKEGYISITPVQFDLTDYSFLENLRENIKKIRA